MVGSTDVKRGGTCKIDTETAFDTINKSSFLSNLYIGTRSWMSEKSGGGICDQCHTPVPCGAKFCMECGNKLQVCAKCHSVIPNDVNFCSSCQQNQKEQIHCILCATVLSGNTDYCYLCSCPQKLNSVTLKECAEPSCQTHLLYISTLCYKCRSKQPMPPPMPAIIRELSQPLQLPFTETPKGVEARLHPSQSSIPGALSQEHLTPVQAESFIPGTSSQEQPTSIQAEEIATADVTLQLSQSSIPGTSSQEQPTSVQAEEIAIADITLLLSQSSIPGISLQEQPMPIQAEEIAIADITLQLSQSSIPGTSSQEQPISVQSEEIATEDITLQLSQSSIPGTSSQEQPISVQAEEIATVDVTLQPPLLSIPGASSQEQSIPVQAEGLLTTEVLPNIPDKATAKPDGYISTLPIDTYESEQHEMKTRSSQSMSERPHFAIDIIQASENTDNAVNKVNDLEETKSCDENGKNKITNVIETTESNEDDHNVIEEKRTKVDAEEDEKAAQGIGDKIDTAEAKVETKDNDEKYEPSQDTPTIGLTLTNTPEEKMPITTTNGLNDVNGTELTFPNKSNENPLSTMVPSVTETKEIDEQKLSMLLKFL